MQLSTKQKYFCQLVSAFLKRRLNFDHFQKKKMTLIADVLPILRTPKHVVR